MKSYPQDSDFPQPVLNAETELDPNYGRCAFEPMPVTILPSFSFSLSFSVQTTMT